MGAGRGAFRQVVILALGAIMAASTAEVAHGATSPSRVRPGVVTGSTNWGLREILDSGPATTTFSLGTRPLVPLVGDWDSDDTRTPGTYEGGVFKLSNTIPPTTIFTVSYGSHPRGFPVAGDFDGDGTDDLAVFRGGTWHIRFADDGATTSVTFGVGTWPGTVPVAGDWNGDGTDGIGTFTLANGTWNLRQTASPGGTSDAGSFVFWNGTGSYPVVGDWDADGDDTVGYKKDTRWFLNNENDASSFDHSFTFGAANDLPVVWAVAATVANQPVGQITADITRTMTSARESALGDVVADAQLAATDGAAEGLAVVAFVNPGSVRADLTFASSPEAEGNGVVTHSEAYAVQSLGNTLVTMTLTGAQIERLLEQQFCGTNSGAFPTVLLPSVSLTYTWDASLAGGAICPSDPALGAVAPASILLNGVTVVPATSYRVTVDEFIAAGGEGFPVLTEGTSRLDGVGDLVAFEAYLATASPVSPPTLNRITRIN